MNARINEPLTPLTLTGTHAYAEKSVAAGEEIHFRISSEEQYRLSIVRLGWELDDSTRDLNICQFPVREGTVQPIRPGSYVQMTESLPASDFPALTLECWVRPRLNKWQGLLTQYTYPANCGFGLFLNPDGNPVFYFGDGNSFQADWLVNSTSPIPLHEWSHLVAVFNQGTGTLWVNGIEHANVKGPEVLNPDSAPLRLAAYGESGFTSYCLDGDLAMPAIYGRALTPTEINARAKSMPPSVPPSTDLLGCWPMTEEKGQSVSDSSPWGRHGEIINHASWMIGGPGFDATAIDRFSDYNPTADLTRGHGLRFASDDLYDCGWNVTETYNIQSELPSGVYVGRIHHGTDLSNHYDVTFIVRRASSRAPAKILVLCATNTWLAYNKPFPSVSSAPNFSLYSPHMNSAPTFQLGVQMPWTVSLYDTYFDSFPGWGGYGHLVRAERYLHVWLEQNGYDYDVISDYDLHSQPEMPTDYEVVIIIGHSEYWSAEAYNAIDTYLSNGGHVTVLSGNTMFWRVSFDSSGEIMECRKLSLVVGQTGATGECYHSHDDARGGLMREAGYPAWRVIGLECVGYNGSAGSYLVTNPQHSFFQGPELLEMSQNQLLGSGTVLHEYDVQLSNIPGTNKPAPGGIPMPQTLAQALTDTEEPVADSGYRYFDYQVTNLGFDVQGVRSEIIEWQREAGGRVFGIGAIAAGRGLMTDPNLAALFRNVLHQFGIVHRLNLLIVAKDYQMYNKWWDGETWGPSMTEWQGLGGNFQTPVEAVAWTPGHISLMGVDRQSHRLLYKWWDGNDWNPSVTEWEDFGGQLAEEPRAVGWGANRLNIFGRGLNGRIYNKWWDGESWGPGMNDWQDMGGDMIGRPAAIAWNGNHLSVAAIGQDHKVKYKFWDGSNWFPSITNWQDLGGVYLTHEPTLIAWGGNRINLFIVDGVGMLWSKWWDGSKWGPSITEWSPLGIGVQSAPAVVMREGFSLSVFAIGTNKQMLAKWWDGNNWGPSQTGWQDLGGSFVGNPTAISWRGKYVSLMALGTNGLFQYKFWDGKQWYPAEKEWYDFSGSLAGQFLTSPSALAWVGK